MFLEVNKMKNNLIKYRVPVLFGSALVLFVCGLMIMENIMTSINQGMDEPVATENIDSGNNNSMPTGAEALTEEILVSPVKEGVSVVRHFYVAGDDAQRQKASMDLFEGVYRPSLGIDFANDGNSFEVLASLSGQVKEVKTDPLFGKCVTIESENGWLTIYQSLSEVTVNQGDSIKQGSVIGKSGENVYEADLGNHVHFVIEKDGVVYDPESNFNKKATQIQ